VKEPNRNSLKNGLKTNNPFSVIVIRKGVGMKKCVFCGCEFESNIDFKQHMDTFGWNKEKHLQKLEDISRRDERERLE
jgi:hypothetical protein